MLVNFGLLILLTLINLHTMVTPQDQDDQEYRKTPIINTSTGKLYGRLDQTPEGEIARFYFPYAKAPVGELRFSRTRPLDKWNEILDATEFTPECPQSIKPLSAKRARLSEDCLNMWTIQPASSLQNGQSKLPVLVSFGYSLDSEQLNLNGITINTYPLVLRHNLIVIRVYYRRSVLGYAATLDEKDGLEGNYGLWDQRMALEWIKDNIAQFGGDPKRVTISGGDFGSQSVAAHILSPYARGLFQNAIMENGPPGPIVDNTAVRTDHTTQIILDRVGCKKAKNRLDCLRNADVDDLINAVPHRLDPFNVQYNSEYVPADRNNLEDAQFNDVNLLISYSQNRGSFVLAALAPFIFTKAQLTYQDALDVVEKIYEPGAAKKILDLYIDSDDGDSIGAIQRGLLKLATDLEITCPSYYYADDIVPSQKNSKTFFFTLNHVPNTRRYPVCNLQPELRGCPSDGYLLTSGIPFVDTELTPYPYRYLYTPEDRQVSDMMMKIYASFIYTGKPPSDYDWPAWNLKNENQTNPNRAIISAKGVKIDREEPEFCLKNKNLLSSDVIEKYYLFDLLPLEKQRKLDESSSMADYNRNTYRYFSSGYY